MNIHNFKNTCGFKDIQEKGFIWIGRYSSAGIRQEICKTNDVATSGNITDKVIIEYIKNQDNNDKGDEEFTTE